MVINKPYEIMNKKEVNMYFEWFMSIKDTRLKYLMKRIFDSEEIIFSEKNIQALHYLMAENIHERLKTEEEIKEELEMAPDELKSTHQVHPKRLIEPTMSISIDIGIYLGEFLLHEFDDLKWNIHKDDRLLQYGRPKVVSKNKHFCPSWVLLIIFMVNADKPENEDKLLQVFNNYRDKFHGRETRAQRFMREMKEKLK